MVQQRKENLLEFIDEEEIIKVYQERLDYLWEFDESQEQNNKVKVRGEKRLLTQFVNCFATLQAYHFLGETLGMFSSQVWVFLAFSIPGPEFLMPWSLSAWVHQQETLSLDFNPCFSNENLKNQGLYIKNFFPKGLNPLLIGTSLAFLKFE